MPPHGLVLEAVTYPPDDELAARAERVRAVRMDEDVWDAGAAGPTAGAGASPTS
ncbi:hypothetical protein D3C74_475880 [compost metagenome]